MAKYINYKSVSQWLSGKESACQYRRHRRHEFNPWVRRIPWRRKWQPTRLFLPENPMDRGAWQATAHGVLKSQIKQHAHVDQLRNPKTNRVEIENRFIYKADWESTFHKDEYAARPRCHTTVCTTVILPFSFHRALIMSWSWDFCAQAWRRTTADPGESRGSLTGSCLLKRNVLTVRDSFSEVPHLWLGAFWPVYSLGFSLGSKLSSSPHRKGFIRNKSVFIKPKQACTSGKAQYC